MKAMAATFAKPRLRLALPVLASILASTAPVARSDDTDINARLQELTQAYTELEHDTERRLASLRAEIDSLKQAASREKDSRGENVASTVTLPRPAVRSSALTVFGDGRLRVESNTANAGAPARTRGVVRARLGAAYALNDRLTAGARLVTGDPDDPNSSDVTLGDFVDDLTVSLDRAYLNYAGDSWNVVGGKFANPFERTDLVWDGDVNPTGAAASVVLPEWNDLALRATGIYSIIDEQALGKDSDMWGGQITVRLTTGGDWELNAAAAYFDYSIGSFANAGPGDFRDNLLVTDGSAYLSDFDLTHAIIEFRYTGLGDRWPLTFTGDWVRNLGAAAGEDLGYSADLVFGRRANVRDWRIRYGYAMAETDAVLAAFSHDNTAYGTNYRQHTLHIEYVLQPDMWLNLTSYYYRRNRAELSAFGTEDYRSRLRLALNVAF